MSNQTDRTARVTTANNAWENLGTLIKDIAGFSNESSLWRDVVAEVPSGAGSTVLVAATDDAINAPTADAAAVQITAGDIRAFGLLELTKTWVKSPTAASVIEFIGTPQ